MKVLILCINVIALASSMLSSILYAKPTTVVTVPIKIGSLQKQSIFVGSLNYKESSKIASQQKGIVDTIYFNVGDKIAKGQKLVSLNTDIMNKELEVKLAKLQEAKYQSQKIRNQLIRYKNLLDTQSIALQQYENLEFELKAKEAYILSLQADYDLSLEETNKMVITSPYSGVILDKLIGIGEWLGVGDPVALMVNTTKVEVIVYVPSNIMTYLELNQKVSLTINNKNYKGNITALIPKADVRTKTFPVHIHLSNQVGFFDGMAVDVHLNTHGKVSGFIVPRDSIVYYQQKNTVFVVRDNIAIAIPVNTLSLQDKQAVVSGAFLDSDLVVARGQDRISNGAEVIEYKTKANAQTKKK